MLCVIKVMSFQSKTQKLTKYRGRTPVPIESLQSSSQEVNCKASPEIACSHNIKLIINMYLILRFGCNLSYVCRATSIEISAISSGRSVVIGDIPWVAQSVEAYLSKLFACSYSAAGISVYSANPSDHLVHRMTHRVVRGCLLACGRPDGRLMALTSCEASVCLSVNQASSIQSIGATCESMTLGHNPYKLPLTKFAVFLKGNRRKYICEHLLEKYAGYAGEGKSCGALMGEYSNLRKAEEEEEKEEESGLCSLLVMEQHQAKMAGVKQTARQTKTHLGKLGEKAVRLAFQERFFGENLLRVEKSVPKMQLAEQQTLSMRLYETRIASLHRAVAFFVMFHQMGKDVQVCSGLLQPFQIKRALPNFNFQFLS